MITEQQKRFIRSTALQLGFDVFKSLKICSKETGSEIAHPKTEQELYDFMVTASRQFTEDDIDYPFKTKPYEHQRKGFELSKNSPYFALLMEMQTGKSKVALDTAGYLYLKKQIEAIVIVAPNGVHRKWINEEVEKHLPDSIACEKAYWKSSPNKKEQAAIDNLLNHKDSLKIFAINFEALTTKRGLDALQRMIKHHETIMIVDEGHYIKNPKAKRTKALLKLGKDCKYKRILTGTPVTQSPLDIWSQFHFLSPDILKCPSFYAFKATYAHLEKQFLRHRTVDVVTGYKNLDTLADLIEPSSYRVLKKDCLDLPDQERRIERIEMSPVQKRLYNSMSAALMSEFEGQVMTAEIILTKYLRLQQIVGGFWTPDNLDVQLEIEGPNPKLNRLLDLLHEIDTSSSVIIWSRFRAELELIVSTLQEKYGEDNVVSYHGGVSGDEKEKAVARFNGKEARFFVGNQKAGGIGLALHTATYMIYFSNDFSMGVREQSEARFYGIGQTKKTCYIDLVMEKTLDEVVLKSLQEKKKLADIVTKDAAALLR